MGFEETSIEMFDKEFNENTVKFYPTPDENFPDMISIVFTHVDFNEEEDEDFQTAMIIYIQNALGELNMVTELDYFDVTGEPDDKSILIPVTKLNEYLRWREKEFVEKYDQGTIEFPEDTYSTIEGEDAEGNVMMAIAVSSLEDWPYKPVFPWWVGVQMEYSATENGLPDEETLQQLHEIEDTIINLLIEKKDIVYAASKTFKGSRVAYFYSKGYKTPSILLHPFIEKYEGDLNLSFFIEKDKYWQRAAEFYGLDEETRAEEEED
jgi:hypothetical protein